MPELPEVETVKRGLVYECLGYTITKAEVHNFKYAEIPPEVLEERIFKEVIRRGKNIFIRLDNGYGLRVHLGMSGQVIVDRYKKEIPKHAHVILTMSGECGDGLRLFFVDPRRFGRVEYISERRWNTFSSSLGPEPWDLKLDYLYNELQRRRKTVWEVIMDQDIIAGIGNIYANEALYAAKIHPFRASNEMTREDVETLILAIQSVMEQGITNGGSSIDQAYVDVYGNLGKNQNNLKLYGKSGSVCPDCGEKIEKMQYKDRPVFACHCMI